MAAIATSKHPTQENSEPGELQENAKGNDENVLCGNDFECYYALSGFLLICHYFTLQTF